MVCGRFIDDKPLTLSEHGWVCVFYCVSHMMFLFSIRAFHLLLFSSYSLLLSKALSVFFLNASHVKLHEFGKSVETKCFRNSVLYSKSTQCCKSFQFRLQDCKPFFNTLGYLSLHLCKHAELSTKILSPLNSTDISIHGGLCALKIVRRKVKVHHTESIVTFAWQMSTFFIFSGNNFCQMNLFEFALRCISFKLPEQTNQ